MEKIKKILLFGVLIPIGLASCSGEIVTTPPPVAVVEAVPAPPRPDYVWIPGYYTSRGGVYTWRNGYYRPAPRYRKVWVPSRYVKTSRGYAYRRGHWRR